jgi:hypothetical protein
MSGHAFENQELVEFQIGRDRVVQGRVVGYMNPTGDPNTVYGFFAVKPIEPIPDYEWTVLMLPELSLKKLTVLDELSLIESTTS